MKVDIAICTHNRPNELCLLLQGLRTQEHQDFDIFIMDDRTSNGIQSNHNVICLINRLKIEGHKVFVFNNSIRIGVSRLRQKLIELIKKWGEGELILSIDDDVIPEQDYIDLLIDGVLTKKQKIEKLKSKIDILEKEISKIKENLSSINNTEFYESYDIVSGLTPPIMNPDWIRPLEKVLPYIDNIELDIEGNITRFDDNCGFIFDRKELVPALHYRSGALFKKKVFDECKFPDNLGFCSFREEEFLGWQAHIKGFKFAIHTGAIIQHLLTPSGGNRNQEYQNSIQMNIDKHKEYTKELFRENGDFIKKAKENIENGRDN